MSLNELQESIDALPISREGLDSVLEELRAFADLPTMDMLYSCRYSIRALGALVPANKFDIVYISRMIGISPGTYISAVLEILMSSGPMEGEINVNTLRALLGMIDDGVRPNIAAEHLQVDTSEYEILEQLLLLERHWASRILDKAEVIISDGGGVDELASTLGIASRWEARKLLRWTKRHMRARQGRI